MTFEESCRILGLSDGASQEERFRVYEDLRAKLNAKLESAPTSGLEAKYRAALERVDRAIERYEEKVDAEELPVFRQGGSSAGIALTQEETTEVAPASESGARTEPKRSFVFVFALGGALLVALTLLGYLYWQGLAAEKERAEAERQRIAAAQAEAERSAAEETRRELDRLRTPFADSAEKLTARLNAIEREFEELQGAQKVADREGTESEKGISQYRVGRYNEFLEWNREYLGQHALVVALANVDDRIEAGEYGEARALLASMPKLASDWDEKIESMRLERYEEPLARFKTSKSFAQVEQRAKVSLARREYDAAISFAKPYENSQYVGKEANLLLGEIYKRQWADLFSKAEQAATAGEFDRARSILDSLESNPEFDRSSEKQSKLVDLLNAEDALKRATVSVEQALDRGDFEQARRELSRHASNPLVRERVEEDLRRIDALEEVWETKQRMISLSESDASLDDTNIATGNKPAPTFDSPPELTRKVEPIYPDLLRTNRVQGYVELEFTIEQDGTTGGIDVLSSSRYEFELPAIEAVRKWRFKPAIREGVAVAARVRQRLEFNQR